MKLETGDAVKATSLMGECWQHSERGEYLGRTGTVTRVSDKDGLVGVEFEPYLGYDTEVIFREIELDKLSELD